MAEPQNLEADFSLLGDRTRDVAEALGDLIARLQGAWRGLGAAGGAAGKALPAAAPAAAPLAPAGKTPAGPAAAASAWPQAASVPPALAAMGQAAAGATGALQNLANFASKMQASPQGAYARPASVQNAASPLTGLAAAAGQATSALAMIPAAIEPFLKAFSPSIIEQFNLALASVMATIGQAFGGAVLKASEFLIRFADVIAPLFESLAPVLTRWMGEFLQRLMPIVKLLVDLGGVLIPVVDVLTQLLKPAQALFTAFVQLWRLWLAVISGLARTFGLDKGLDLLSG